MSKTLFTHLFKDPATYPILGMISIAGAWMFGSIGYNLVKHPEARWSPKDRKENVLPMEAERSLAKYDNGMRKLGMDNKEHGAYAWGMVGLNKSMVEARLASEDK